VRDDESYALLADDKVIRSGDDVTLGIGPDNFDPRETRSIMLNLQSDFLDEDGIEALARSVLSTAEFWEAESYQMGYVECMPGGDRRLFDVLEPSLPELRFYPFVEVWRDGLPARRGQRWMTTRFHAHMMAAAAGSWGVAFPINDYYVVKHTSLVEAGSHWELVTPGETATGYEGEPGFGPALDSLAAAKADVARKIYTSG